MRADPVLEQGFLLEGLRIDPPDGVVVGPGGREKLDPKIMSVLVLMAQHAGHVVSREELHDRLWPNAVVTEDALTRCFHELRRQLSLAGGDERFRALIETLPKRGYRLNGTVAPLPEGGQAPHANRSKARLIAIAAAFVAALSLAVLVAKWNGAASAGDPSVAARTADSIAVLPFVDLSAAQDQAFLADGITEEILNRLAQAGELRVIARTSSFSFRDETLDVAEIAERLDVTHVLEGSIRTSGDRVRVTAQLISASDESHVWSETYDRDVRDLFAIQDEIATAVATALQVSLGARQSQHVTAPSVAAYGQFLQGQFFYNRRATGDIARSVEYYEKALAIDPDFARAWAALAGACALLAAEGDPDSAGWRTRQGQAAHKAVELDSQLAVAHARLSQFYFQTGDRERGGQHFELAVALDPNDPLVLGHLSSRALFRGDLDQAITHQRKIVALDPVSFSQRKNLAAYLQAAGQLEEALVETRNAKALNPAPELDVDIARLLTLEGRHDEARAVVAAMPEGKHRDQALAMLFQAPGLRPESDAALKRLALRSRVASDSESSAVRLAEAYALRGMKNEAFAVLAAEQQALALDAGSSRRRKWELNEALRFSHFLKALHGDPRWTELLAEPS